MVRDRDRSKAGACRVLALLFVLVSAPAWSATIFERVEVQPSARGTVMRMEFTAPMRYLSHTPHDLGSEVRILLRAVNDADFDPLALFGRESIGWRPEQSELVEGLDYDGTRQPVPRIVVSFRKPVGYSVRTSPDQRALIIVIKPEPADLGAPPSTPAPPSPTLRRPAPARALQYLVHLRSDTRPIDPAAESGHPAFAGRQLFVSQTELKGQTWYRLNLGYFASADAARAVADQLKDRYPGAWISRQSVELPETAPPAATATETDRRVPVLMERARAAMTDGQYRLAAQLFTSVLELSQGPAAREARELLGLARERSGQFAHAISEYETYLQQYPDGPDADRVRQRLAGLLTARPLERELAQADAEPSLRERPASWDWAGSFSQYYYRDEDLERADGELLNQSDLSSWVNLDGRRRGPRFDLRMRLSAGNELDFIDEDDSEDLVFTDLYVDLIDKRTRLSGRFGRQRQASSGSFGRFDGLGLGYQWRPDVRLGAIAGYPVDLNDKTRVQTDQPLFGVNASFGPYAEHWNLTAYAVEQRLEGLVDRRAVGGEVRYVDPRKSLFVLGDYDTLYEELSTFLVLANWTLNERTSIYATLDQRFSPPLATRNALQGQLATSLDELRQSFSDEEIEALAADRSARTQSLSVGGIRRLDGELQLSLDLTASETGSTPASGGVPAEPGTGTEYFYTLQWLGEDFLFDNGTTILTLRYADTSSARIHGAILDYRYALPRSWRISPRVDLQYREQLTIDSDVYRLRPELSLEYRGWQRGHFEARLGFNWTRTEEAVDTTETTTTVFNLGYRVDF